ncbi:adenylate kinase [uncultured Streptococcus sp.]|uniref:adenylate kinase n=1 Tax=uncultured Streptococcus sp. TaxID=83427 RepID=UPI002594A6A1|nr:adenylate kinase [uncultured Streptococcus sp.]
MSKNGLGLHVVLTGAPGCGKGTQARLLKEKAHICHLSTGEMLRAEAAKKTPEGLALKEVLDKGGFATDEMIINMVSKRIDEDDCKNGFILDGFPRTLPQAEVLEKMLEDKGIKLDAVIEIQVPDEIIMERILGRYACMKCGQGYHDKYQKPQIYGVCDKCGGTEFYRRIDDNRATVQNRLVNYRALTYPTIPYFEKKGLLRTVDGTGSIPAVAAKIDEILGVK